MTSDGEQAADEAARRWHWLLVIGYWSFAVETRTIQGSVS
jgi:hypothetical protein